MTYKQIETIRQLRLAAEDVARCAVAFGVMYYTYETNPQVKTFVDDKVEKAKTIGRKAKESVQHLVKKEG